MVKRKKRETPFVSEEQCFSRRALMLGGIQGLLGLSLVGRLAYLGSYKGSTYKALSDENRIKVQFLLPKRGLIKDRSGRILADNQQAYRLMIVPDQTKNVRATLEKFSTYYSLDQEDIEDLIESIRYKPKFLASTIVDGLSWKEVCYLEASMRDFPGCFIERGWSRFYPYGLATAHLIGYVQTPSRDDQNKNSLYRLADFRLGKSGIEKNFDKPLRGRVGYRRIEVNSRTRTVQELVRQESQPGFNTTLTIDLELQNYVQERMAQENSGSCAVLDVKSGEVLALTSSPSFDANLFTNGIRSKDWKELASNPYGCLHNKSIHGLYPPGSLFKMVVALAAFESGIVSSTHSSVCRGYIDVGSHRFHCWHKHGGHGRLSIVNALAQSCDVYFYEIAQLIGAERIKGMALKLGFGIESGIELPHEKSGLIPSPSWKKRVRGKNWMRGDTVNLSIGQGALLATPLQLAVMTARLANLEGKAVSPTLLRSAVAPFEDLNIKKLHLDLIRKGLDQTVNSPHGLAYRNRIIEPDFAMAGKTATCQVRRISMAERKKGIIHNNQRPWGHRDHALFSGFAPAHDPKYALAVVVEHGGAGGRVAAPLGHDILLKTQQIMSTKKSVIRENLT
ncbi:MAG TPA: penicillin-binding protein 2 [Holosporales bacterium]|nr:penicillin-binding protein 2 [Holosporales bacterium]